jgi:hypothetical protein
LKCPLCDFAVERPWVGTKDSKTYWRCSICNLVFLDLQHRLSDIEERDRYGSHTDTVGDNGYMKFVEPLLKSLRENVKSGAVGLDFGCGRQSAITEYLENIGCTMTKYDPVFWPNSDLLVKGGFDFVVSCEVIEHFHSPRQEFTLLKSLLRPGGQLFVMTHFYDRVTDFADWYYRRDPTHVSFFSDATCQWLATYFEFKEFAVQLTERRSVARFVL